MGEGFTVLDADGLKDRLLENHTLIVLDVRTPWEFQTGHIPDALLVPIDELSDRHAIELNCEDEIVCVCEHGIRSAVAARFLVSNGYTNIAHLEGGMVLWDGEVE